jgi:hypothetical protein
MERKGTVVTSPTADLHPGNHACAPYGVSCGEKGKLCARLAMVESVLNTAVPLNSDATELAQFLEQTIDDEAHQQCYFILLNRLRQLNGEVTDH